MKMVPLGEVAALGSGGTPRRSVSEYFGEGTPWLSIADLNDGVVHGARESLTPAGIANSSAKVVPPGTLFVAMYGSIGKLAIAGRSLCTSQAIAFVNPDETVLDRKYLFHYLLSQRPHLQALGRGGTQMNIGQGDLKKWPIPLPPLREQRRIAAILDHADALRVKRRQVITHFDDLTTSIFLEMFGGVAERQSLSKLGLDFTSGRNVLGSNLDSHETNRVIKVSAISSGYFDSNEAKPMPASYIPPNAHRVERGDILFGRASGSLELLGATAVVDQDCKDLFLPDKVWRLEIREPARIVPEFILEVLRSSEFRAFIKHNASGAAGVRNIGKTKVLSYRAPAPSLQVQEAFAKHAAAIRSQSAQATVDAGYLDALFASLQSRAFRGEL